MLFHKTCSRNKIYSIFLVIFIVYFYQDSVYFYKARMCVYVRDFHFN